MSTDTYTRFAAIPTNDSTEHKVGARLTSVLDLPADAPETRGGVLLTLDLGVVDPNLAGTRVIFLELPPIFSVVDLALLPNGKYRFPMAGMWRSSFLSSERFGTGPLYLDAAMLDRFCGYAWPGNVRELVNTVERLVALSHNGALDSALFPSAEAVTPALGLRERVEAYERGLIVEALREAAGNQAEAARRLGLPRVTLHDKLRRHGLEV
jgi:hypothetical protein